MSALSFMRLFAIGLCNLTTHAGYPDTTGKKRFAAATLGSPLNILIAARTATASCVTRAVELLGFSDTSLLEMIDPRPLVASIRVSNAKLYHFLDAASGHSSPSTADTLKFAYSNDRE